jgi:hypothetical protein
MPLKPRGLFFLERKNQRTSERYEKGKAPKGFPFFISLKSFPVPFFKRELPRRHEAQPLPQGSALLYSISTD